MKKKLIEVGLPLAAINEAASREKSIRHGHPSTLHLWWARRPLAACRAVLFASLVDDPSAHPEQFPTPEAQAKERERLFGIIEQLVQWKNSNDEAVLAAAKAEILKSTGGAPPPVLDPFCGGGSIPLEAQRLGLEAHGSDLNPVAVLITKALIEIPPRFAGRAPISPEARKKLDHGKGWQGAAGLAEDIRFYGAWMRQEAEKRIGHLYPKAEVTAEMAKNRPDLRPYAGKKLTVIAWLWARTVRCPNPACGAEMPLVRSFWLSTKEGKKAWVEPIVDRAAKRVRFEVRVGAGQPPAGTVGRAGARCALCETPVALKHVRAEGRGGRMGVSPLAVVAEGRGGRVYVNADLHAPIQVSRPGGAPDIELPRNPRDFKTPNYGMRTFADLFTARQLVALTTFSDLVGEARERALADARAAPLAAEGRRLADGGSGAVAYADAVGTYLAMAVSKLTAFSNVIARWRSGEGKTAPAFGRQAIPMTWDFAETNPFAGAGGDFEGVVAGAAGVLGNITAEPPGAARQADAMSAVNGVSRPLISTDPPYYDNIGYADLSDFFYVWLRRSLQTIYPDLFRTVLTPKAEELIATPYRFDGRKEKAQEFFERGLAQAFERIRAAQHPDYPLTVYYAYKQSESDESEEDDEASAQVASTGWETMLNGLLAAGFAISGTWPLRTEMRTRQVAMATNALASSIALVCRPRAEGAPLATRKEFLVALRRELPAALKTLQAAHIAPVDLAQAAIGPGMAVFSRYSKVIEPEGGAMSVRTALALINEVLAEVVSAEEGELDVDTRWAIAWFEQHGMSEGPFGDAETLSKAKNTSLRGLIEAGIVKSSGGKARLLRREELAADWDPAKDDRLTAWEATQQLIRRLEDQGESAAAELLARLGGGLGETARNLAYRLYVVCERKGWAAEARGYNGLVMAWPAIEKHAQLRRPAAQAEIFS